MQEREAGIRICHSLQKTFLLFGFSASRCQVVIPLKSGIQGTAIWVNGLVVNTGFRISAELQVAVKAMTTCDCLDCSRVGMWHGA